MIEKQSDIIFLDAATPLKHPFFQKQIVFTGGLSTMTRVEAAKRARQFGATIQGAVTRDTDFVILGAKRRGKSTKQLKAEQLVQLGYDIQILEEDDFLWVLSIQNNTF